MLAVSPLRNSAGDAGATNLPADDDGGFSAEFDFDFSELFVGFDDGEVLPGLEVDPSEILLAFSSPETVAVEAETVRETGDWVREGGASGVAEREEMVSVEVKEALSSVTMEEGFTKLAPEVSSSALERERGRKPPAGHAKGSNGKRKMKVDWTPELHRQFVQAVEQLGVEKAVPSRILELMGIDCLTRHNIASHLQKYRCHRKHMMVREAEATSWSQRRQVYAIKTTTEKIAGPAREISSWMAPTIGFPPGSHHHHHQAQHMHVFRPLHVWGHPTTDRSFLHMWPPKHLFPIRPAPSPPWVISRSTHQHPPPLPSASPWDSHYSRDPLTQGMPYFAHQVPTLRIPALPVAGIPPQPLYRPGEALPTAMPPTPAPTSQTDWQLHHDAHPSKESIDAAIGEVLARPWLPVPLGLKPPSLESVMVELQKQGISVVPPCN